VLKVTKQKKLFMNINVDWHPTRVRPKTRWMDCVKDGVRIKGVTMEMTSDRKEWKKKTCCADNGMMILLCNTYIYI
jgi:hypothetical protein